MKIARSIPTVLATLITAMSLALFAPGTSHLATAGAAVTTTIGGNEAGGAANGGMDWVINYDDTTHQVTTTALGSGFAYESMQLTATLSRSVAYYPSAGAASINPDLAARMAAADFQIIADGSTAVLATIAPAQVRRIVTKAGGIGGLTASGEWSRF